MRKSTIELNSTGLLPDLVCDYLDGHNRLKGLYEHEPAIGSFEKAIRNKGERPVDRKLLTSVLRQQYAKIKNETGSDFKITDDVIGLLEKENTFCVTTGHQLNIFTGPLYFLHKVFSVIGLAGKLARVFPGMNFIPVYWMASEDHDIDEINHVHVFGKKLTWNPATGGAAGKLGCSTMAPVLDELKSIMGDSAHACYLDELFRKAYLGHDTLADATRYLVHTLAGKYGLLIVDGDDDALKRAFAKVMEDDLFNHTAYRCVSESTQALSAHYKAQVHPREINLFMLKSGSRERIEKKDGAYVAVDSGESFTGDQAQKLLSEEPGRLSPNVVLRPLYQEMVLPNLAYVGGPAEVSYWLQYKSLFDHYQIPFPVLLLRSMILWIDGASAGRMQALGFAEADLVKPVDTLTREYVEREAGSGVVLDREIKDMESLFDGILQKAAATDDSLRQSIEGEKMKAVKQLKTLEGKLVRAEKRKHDSALAQIVKLKEKLFPAGALHERHDSFIPLYLKHGESFLEQMKENLDPLDTRLQVFSEIKS